MPSSAAAGAIESPVRDSDRIPAASRCEPTRGPPTGPATCGLSMEGASLEGGPGGLRACRTSPGLRLHLRPSVDSDSDRGLRSVNRRLIACYGLPGRIYPASVRVHPAQLSPASSLLVGAVDHSIKPERACSRGCTDGLSGFVDSDSDQGNDPSPSAIVSWAACYTEASTPLRLKIRPHFPTTVQKARPRPAQPGRRALTALRPSQRARVLPALPGPRRGLPICRRSGPPVRPGIEAPNRCKSAGPGGCSRCLHEGPLLTEGRVRRGGGGLGGNSGFKSSLSRLRRDTGRMQ
jgi:hypothetical protein